MYASDDPVTHAPGTTSISLSAVPVLRWHSPTGALPPSDKLRIKVYAYVQAWASTVNTDTGGNVHASNGFDTGVGTASQVKSEGSHLLQKDNAGRSTEVRFPAVTLNGSATGIVDSNGQGVGSICWWAINVVQDPRSVAIASSAEPNSKRGRNSLGNWIAVPNVRNANGSMSIDTVTPLEPVAGDPYWGPNILQYSPIYSRSSWGSNSTYAWSSSGAGRVTSSATSGTFNGWWPNWDVADYFKAYINPNPIAGASDSITLKLVDGADGAVAENSYDVTFHNPYEDFGQDYFNKQPPSPTNHTDDLAAPWSFVTSISGPGTYTRTLTGTIELGSEWSVEGSSGSEALKKLLVLKVGYKHTERESRTVTSTATWGPIPSNERWEFYSASVRIHRGGPCSSWAVNGYAGETRWSVTETPEELEYWYVIKPVVPVP